MPGIIRFKYLQSFQLTSGWDMLRFLACYCFSAEQLLVIMFYLSVLKTVVLWYITIPSVHLHIRPHVHTIAAFFSAYSDISIPNLVYTFGFSEWYTTQLVYISSESEPVDKIIFLRPWPQSPRLFLYNRHISNLFSWPCCFLQISYFVDVRKYLLDTFQSSLS